jgi:hypothetical protein
MRRKIHYFRIDLDEAIPEESRRPFGDTLKFINDLSTQDRTLQYQGLQEDSVRMMQVRHTGDHYRGIIAKYRSDSTITGSLNDDALVDLALDEDVKIVEITHFVYFTATRILAVEYNQSGPREGTIRWYINGILSRQESDPPAYTSMPVFHPDVITKLASAREIKILELELPKERVTALADGNNFFSALDAASHIGNTGRVGLTLSGSKKKGDRTPLMSGSQLVHDIRAGEIDLSYFGKVIAVAAFESGTDVVNLLENRISSVVSIVGPLTTSRETEWFDKIVSNYQSNRQLLLSAASDEQA